MYNFDTNTSINSYACKIFEKKIIRNQMLAKVLQNSSDIDRINFIYVHRDKFKYFSKVGMQYTNLRK